jgi:diguanylate cyclase (GGDEF)-like protein/PAS domain S-box-containing protein
MAREPQGLAAMRSSFDTEPVRTPAADPAAIERSLAAAFDATPAGMALTDLSGRLLRVNDGFCDLLGYDRETLQGGMSLRDVSHPDDETPDRTDRRSSIESGGHAYRVEKRFIRADGKVIWAVASVTVMCDEQGEPVHLLGLVQEITESKRLQADLTRLALQDPLTGLANRTLLDDRLRVALARAGRHGSLTGVLFLDLDGFKAINDEHGHHVGDELLRAVARRLRAVLRPADVVARLGGDEFVAICEELSGLEEAHAIASRVEVAIADPIDTDAGPLTVCASVGLALAEGSRDADADELIRRADEAMYRAKNAGAAASA